MTPEQEKQYREDLRKSNPVGQCGPMSKMESIEWAYIEARKKSKKEIDGLKEQIASIKEIKQYPTALAYISELKEELKRERLFSSKFEIQSMKGYPTPKEWSELSSENMKTQQRRRIDL